MKTKKLFHPAMIYASEFPEVDKAFRRLERKLEYLEIDDSLCEQLRRLRDGIEDRIVERTTILSKQKEEA